MAAMRTWGTMPAERHPPTSPGGLRVQYDHGERNTESEFEVLVIMSW